MEELISLKVDLKDLKENVENFDENLQVHGKELLDKRIELTKLLRTYNNIRNARSQIVNCLSLLHRAKQIQTTLQTVFYFLFLFILLFYFILFYLFNF